MNDAIVIGEDLYYAISLNEILWGGVLLAITMFIHASGMVLTLRASEFLNRCFARSQSHVFLLGLSILIVASWMLIGIHLAEVTIWAAFYIWKGAIANPSMAFYLALVNYCSLNSGYLPQAWRLLEGMLSMAGLLSFAWSTGTLFLLAQEFQQRVLQPSDQAANRKSLGIS